MNETIIIHTLLSLLFLAVGSFIAAITYRIPKGLGFVKGRSFCDSCKKELKWYDNIPLISFLFYRGRSRCCDKRISIRYPLIELFAGLCAITIWIVFANPLLVVLFFLTLIIFVIDFEYQLIPDELSWIVMATSLLFMVSSPFEVLFVGLFSAFLLLSLNLLTGGRGMGLGDVKLAIGLGSLFAFIDTLTWLMMSFVIGGIVASILLILKKANLKTKIAFGPFLIIGFWITLIYIKIYR